jgi:hypothetical protein
MKQFNAFIKDIRATTPTTTGDYLSQNFSVADLSTKTTFPHSVQPQLGLSKADIIENMRWLVVNVIEPINSKFPGFNINSGFRVGTGKSQHNVGCAVDLQWPNIKKEDMGTVAVWIAENILFDQFIFEHGNGVWLHVSFDHRKPAQRQQILTQYNNAYSTGIANYFT